MLERQYCTIFRRTSWIETARTVHKPHPPPSMTQNRVNLNGLSCKATNVQHEGVKSYNKENTLIMLMNFNNLFCLIYALKKERLAEAAQVIPK